MYAELLFRRAVGIPARRRERGKRDRGRACETPRERRGRRLQREKQARER